MLVPAKTPPPIVEAVVAGLNNDNTKRAYRRCLTEFCAWLEDQGNPPLNRQVVTAWKSHLLESGASSSALNLSLTAIRRLVDEAAMSGWITDATAAGINKVEGIPKRGRRSGNWLTKEACQKLIALPDGTLVGKRDAAVVALLVGGALRVSEAAAAAVEQYQTRDGRWLLVDLVGKGNRTRTVVLAPWAADRVAAWIKAAGLRSGPILRSLHRCVVGDSLTDDGIRWIVARLSKQLGLPLAPHDCRRTAALLAKRGGADWEQVRDFLGHASVTTTEAYVSTMLATENPASDFMGL